jgi:putative addiction module component (TIGR02574 family)
MRLHPDFDFSSLSAPDRIRLALALWDSLGEDDVDAASPLTAAQAADLDARVTEMNQDGDPGMPWDLVVERAQQKSTAARRRG